MKKVLLLVMLAAIFVAAKVQKPAYRLFDSNGKKSEYAELFKDAQEADIVMFGELHNNPVCHWLQYELTKDLFSVKNAHLVIGAEMFEADNQLLIDEYLEGKIQDKHFEAEAKLWNNYKTDYKPLLSFAQEKQLRFIATNIPRRYASIVHASGFEGLASLTPEAKEFIAPLPIQYDPELKCYKDMLEMGGMGHSKTSENLPKAQAVKDATMAFFILKNRQPGTTFIHYNGSYHSDNFEGIVWYLKQADPGLKILTISSAEQEKIDTLAEGNEGRADYIICIPASMTKTY